MDTNSRKYSCLFLFCVGNLALCFAQHTLQKEYIHMRANDTIVKQEVAYKNPGRSGADVFWNFSKVQATKIPYRVCYSGNDTLVSCKEHFTGYNYFLNPGDSLFLSGYRNRTAYFNAILPGIELRYPFHYADSIGGFYYGEGKYSDKLAFVSQGRTMVKADAWGTMLLPDNDTLKNVMRVCFQKDICEKVSVTDSILLKVHGDSTVLDKEHILEHLQNDMIMLRMKDYRWYAEGYRYPVFETVHCETFRLGIPVAYYTTAFYYPPEEHVYLENDLQNLQLQEVLKEKGLSAHRAPSSQGGKEQDNTDRMHSELSVYYNTYPNPVKENLTIEYYLSEDASVQISLFDMSGRLLQQEKYDTQASGVHEEILPMDTYPRGTYILRLIVSDITYVEKIIKE